MSLDSWPIVVDGSVGIISVLVDERALFVDGSRFFTRTEVLEAANDVIDSCTKLSKAGEIVELCLKVDKESKRRLQMAYCDADLVSKLALRGND